MYIEFVIADNFLLTFLAGASAARLAKCAASILRIILAAAAGTLVAVFYPMMAIGPWYMLAIKAALWAFLSAVMYFKRARPITCALLFLLCTFALGGSGYAATLMSERLKGCPLFVMLGAGALVYICIKYASKRLAVARARAPYEYTVSVEVFGETLCFTAFLDTGNCVFDGRTGLPVAIVDATAFVNKLGASGAAEFVKNLDRFRKLDIVTPAGEAAAYMIKPAAATVYSDRQGHKIDVMLGLVRGAPLSHEMLLGPTASEAL